jgi:1-deoxy-D-xylulose-5-phosphate reductoisomerase
MKKRVTILGSTGSVGRQTLDVVARYPEKFEVVGLAAGKNVEKLADQVARFRPRVVSVVDAAAADELASRLAGVKPEILHGESGAMAVAIAPAEVVMAAMVGAAGLPPTLAAVEAGRDVALANKEVLVMAGELVTKTAARTGARLLPVDSEHCALHQALGNRPADHVHRLVLTASGGPFLDLPEEEFALITPERAVKHPRWDMGAKISIDSSTLLNKGFEVLEAKWLFGIDESRIGIVVHPEAIVHSLVEFVDGSTIAQLGLPDMAVPIAYALAWPDRLPGVVKHCDLAKLSRLNFREPDHERFPAIRLAYDAAAAGGTAPAMLVAADDVAVQAFLEHRIDYRDITRVLADTLQSEPIRRLVTLEDVREAERLARAAATRLIGRRSPKAALA